MSMRTLKNRHIVAIDDAASVLTFLRVSLEEMGAKFHDAQTAAGGLALCEQVKPDVVVLDLGLPDKEGFNILPQIKRVDGKRSPVVVVLTVRNDLKYKAMAEALGADAYITKPFRMEDLVDVIHAKLGITQPEPAH
jgi:DNA-binding response OmpR family regulator